MQHKFDRLEILIGKEKLEYLSKKSVLVLGIGGVGGYVVESLVRSGIGKIIIVDYDKIDETNINRQIIANIKTVGRKKVDVLEERIKDINPNCCVVKIDNKVNEKNYLDLFNYDFDFLVDSCDTVLVKKLVIKKCSLEKIPFISCMGMAKRMDPSKIEIVDIRKTENDPLAKIIRKFVKDEQIKNKIMVCSSKELPIKIDAESLGSSAFVPSSAGLLIGSYVLNYFLNH